MEYKVLLQIFHKIYFSDTITCVYLCVCIGSESVVIRNLTQSLKESPGRSPDTSSLQNGALHGDHSTRKRTRVAVLISGTGVCSLLNLTLTLNVTAEDDARV